MGHIKVIQSGNLLEIYTYEKELPKNRITRKKGRSKGYKRFGSRRFDNVARLRKNFARLVRANLARPDEPALLTLTMSNFVRISTAYECFGGFTKRLRERFKEVKYIAVPEFQKKGRVHFHMIVWGLPDSVILHEGSTGYKKKGKRNYVEWLIRKGYGIRDVRNTRLLQRLWGYGFCDITPTDGSSKLATYLAKYMQKAVFDKRLLLQKSYVSSRGIMRPMSTSLSQVGAYAQELWGVDDLLPREKNFDTVWLGRCNYKSFNLEDFKQ